MIMVKTTDIRVEMVLRLPILLVAIDLAIINTGLVITVMDSFKLVGLPIAVYRLPTNDSVHVSLSSVDGD